ncbi:hypothetical protein BGW80DRAFT_1379499 [Lactifluus volemus]|nr:hypothetical protein BGW80DRAFT_1379499 [Lactifluus volemus]
MHLLVFDGTSSLVGMVVRLLSLENKSLVVPGSSRTPHTVGSAKMTIIPALEATTTGIHINSINLFASSGVTY